MLRNAESPTHEQVAEFYDRVYYGQQAGESPTPTRHLRRLAKRLGVRSEQRVLDVACGCGAWLSAVAACGVQVSGIDLSARAIETCRKSHSKGRFHIGPAEHLPFADHEFDLVTCLGSLEHFLDQPSALQEMARVARPNGRVLVLVPNAGFLTYRLGLFGGTAQRDIQETIRSLSEWQAMFSAAGLETIERWKDLHILNRAWILRPPRYQTPLRLAQALMLPVWPLEWQYQVYHLCRVSSAQG